MRETEKQQQKEHERILIEFTAYYFSPCYRNSELNSINRKGSFLVCYTQAKPEMEGQDKSTTPSVTSCFKTTMGERSNFPKF